MSSIKKMLARVHHVVVFSTKVLHFKIENTPIKNTNGKVQWNAQIPFCGQKKSFAMKLSFEEFTIVSTRRIVALGLFSTNQGSEVQKLEVHSVFIKVSWTFSTF